MSRTSVLLLFGGESPEHDVSIMSARNVYAAMDNSKYEIHLCFIDKSGRWWLLDRWKENPEHHGGVQLVAALGTKSFLTVPGSRILHPDVILPILHGHKGEDGTIQGLAELMHIPIVGCDTAASVACWDKLMTKRLLAANDIPVVEYAVYQSGSERPSYDSIAVTLGTTLFVKPTRAGSSIGVHKVTKEKEFASAIQDAQQYSPAVLIERAINGRELEVAVLGNPPAHRASGVGEIKPGDTFYSYDDKYAADSDAEVLTHADIDDATAESVRSLALKAYQTVGCRGLARVDFLLSDDGTAYINEINTLPGFTNISQYPKLWHEQGMKYPELIDRMIRLAFG